MLLEDVIIEKYFLKEYKNTHLAPSNDGYSSPLYNVCLNGTYPKDFYSPKTIQYYGTGSSLDSISANIIKSIKDKPEDEILVYRSIPKNLSDTKENNFINKKDWVTINKKYAIEHGERTLNGEYYLKSKKVKVKHLWTDGNSIHEQGYDPD